HGALDLVAQVVNDGVQSDIHALLLGERGRVALRPYAEADDDGVGGLGQQHVALVDGAHAGVNDAHLDLVGGELLECLGEHFRRASNVGLDDDGQLLYFSS